MIPTNTSTTERATLETCADRSLFVIEPGSGIGVLIGNSRTVASSEDSPLTHLVRDCLQPEGSGYWAA